MTSLYDKVLTTSFLFNRLDGPITKVAFLWHFCCVLATPAPNPVGRACAVFARSRGRGFESGERLRGRGGHSWVQVKWQGVFFSFLLGHGHNGSSLAWAKPRSQGAEGKYHESDDESYEVLDLTEYARRHHWWNRVFGRNSGPIVEKYSVATQIAMGGVTGWCAGFLFQKVGKLAATAVGGGFLLLQIASHSGYVQVDWKRVEKDVNKAKKQLKKRANKAAPEINTLIEESTEFIKQNIVVSSGFVGGFLLGLAS
ncbi:FUN14 domain-containing protein 1 [Alligator sinensis]|uniref:FUN14 domain-containing protein 1 n=1 Tax=Alligator sinensis TaxID=38654 RepID=A0A3Q0GMR6_ALLSI|nr:FUN14 domain-containing protein 1 [Alligator sinensis]